jgi:hypothetical protein
MSRHDLFPHSPSAAHQEAGMTRRDDESQGLGGHAGERKRQFERARGLPEARDLDLPESPGPAADDGDGNGNGDGDGDGESQDGARR